jgi:hypothetical protein
MPPHGFDQPEGIPHLAVIVRVAPETFSVDEDVCI